MCEDDVSAEDETREILNDPEFSADIRRGLAEIERGELYTFEQVFGKDDDGWVREEAVLRTPEVQDAIRFGVQDFEAWKEGLPMPSRACRRPVRRFLGGVWHFAGWLRWKARL